MNMPPGTIISPEDVQKLSASIAISFEPFAEALKRFGQAISQMDFAVWKMTRELTWINYTIRTCRTPLSEALKPW